MRNLTNFDPSTQKSQKFDATFEGKLTCAFKNDMRNLANFYQSRFESLKIGNSHLLLECKVEILVLLNLHCF